MTEYVYTNIRKWLANHDAALDAVARQAINDTLAGIEIVPGKERGGAPQKGQIPRDTGFLAASLVSEVHGGGANQQKGEQGYVMAISGMKAESVATFVWTAEYAAAVHFGVSGTKRKGLFWLEVATAQWPARVALAARRAKIAFKL